MKRLVIAVFFAAGAAAATPSFALTKADDIGQLGNPASADRTLHVTPDTRSLDVQSGETVNLDVNGERTTWNFDGLDWVVNLQDIVPSGPNVNVYVFPNPDDK